MISVKGMSSEALQTVSGVVTEIERYAIHDGLGIRSTVFLKGCPLACQWCSNPETQMPYAELGVFTDKCIACNACLKACPYGAITIADGEMRTDRTVCKARCYPQGQVFPCVKTCYTGARIILGERKTAREVVDEVARDQAFFDESNGGMTLSGGEPMAQPDFAYAVARLCRERWINTAMETCGAGELADYDEILPYLDMLFIDVKGVNPQKYRTWVGAEPDRQLRTVRHLAKRCNGDSRTRLVVRTPIIPGFNDTPVDVEAIAAFLEEIGAQGAELLPYHKLGRSKYTAIGRDYALQQTQPPADEAMAELNRILEKHNVPVLHF